MKQMIVTHQTGGICWNCRQNITGHYIFWKGMSGIEMHPGCARKIGETLAKEVKTLERYEDDQLSFMSRPHSLVGRDETFFYEPELEQMF